MPFDYIFRIFLMISVELEIEKQTALITIDKLLLLSMYFARDN